ncbi:retroviral-like aspartic protease family protein [Arsenophonus nasoniae]|uniref:Retroviral-like aspartic protease family protein n=1 Tax=Arsenophonus nasoniae TaxID=638 RepID=A0AA95KF14_9GAMM|nr:retroviral-like aspartic protease family protein [Arsenophonus nasoniae]WGM03698.1 retroviral-like aspartic protease family protein [Arsenophonus nasoniae]
MALLTSSLSGCTVKKPEKSNEAANDILNENFYSSLVIPVSINNKLYHFLVDTGASITIIDEEIAKEITQEVSYSSLHPFHKEIFSNFKSVHDKIDVKNLKFLKPVSMFIGKEEVSDNEIWIAKDLSLFTQAVGTNIDGIIGIDTFRKFNWQIDNKKRLLTISKKSPSISTYSYCIAYSDAYGESPSLYLDYGNNDYIKMRVDTGNDGSDLGNDFLEYFKKQNGKITPIKYNISAMEVTGLIKRRDYILTGLKFNNHPLGEIRIAGNNNNQYLLGMNFLSRFNRYAFMPSKMLFCYDTNSLHKENQYPVRNIGVRYYNNRIEIFYNENKELDKYHLKNGDIIKNINGIDYPPQEIDKVRKILSLTPKGELTLIIERMGIEQKTVI